MLKTGYNKNLKPFIIINLQISNIFQTIKI